MPEFTGLWLYLGSFTGIPVSSSSYPTLAQAQSLQGFVSTAFQNPPYPATNSDFSLAEVTWTVDGNNSAFVNNATGQTSVGTYDVGNGPVSSQMNFTANYIVEIILADGSVIQDGISVVQYSNGDLFVRPSATLSTNLLEVPNPLSGIRILTHVPTSSGQTGFASFTGPRSFQNAEGEVPPIICFTRGTLILTAEGEIPVEDLVPGMKLRTADHGFQPIRWIGSRQLTGAMLEALPQYRPVRIRAGALGPDLPARDLVVSPQHRVMIRSAIAERMTGCREVLAAAKHLLGTPGIELVEDAAGVEYWHFLCDRHQIIWAEGVQTETLYTGPMALRSLCPEARAELFGLFPELAEIDHARLPDPARPLLSGPVARSMAQRHVRNRRAYLS